MEFMTIKSAAAEADLSAGTLREYEKAGLLSPQRDSVGRRLYCALDVQMARQIAAARRAARGRLLRGRPEAVA